MAKYKHLLLIFLLFSFKGLGQQFIDKAVMQLDSFAIGYPQEKVFVHTDRNQYIAGETIWFNTYTTLDNKPSFLSKVVYVELVNNKGAVIQKRMLPITDGSAYGDMVLHKDLPAGNYNLNAYTLWMLNFPDFIFSKQLVVFNNENKIRTGAKSPTDFNINFFAEGGELIAGIKSKIAFKAVYKNGLPPNVSGTIVDAQNKKLVSFSSFHDGMGSFEFAPAIGAQYKAEVISGDGNKKLIPFLVVKEEGIVLHVNNDNPSRLFIQLIRSEKNANTYNAPVVIAQINNEVVYTGKFNFDSDQNAAAIPKKSFPPGIIHITVFNNGLPLAERLAFISNYDSIRNEVFPNLVSTVPRKKNTLTIDFPSYKNINASLAIINAGVDSSMMANNILVNNYLTADLKGYINQPGYYFKDKTPSTLQALDLLMLTHGWRRFTWNNLLADQFPILKYTVESGIGIAGKLSHANGKAELQKGRIDFITKADDSTTILTTATLTNQSEFYIPDLHFKKSATIYYQGTNEQKEKALTQVLLYPSYFDTLKSATRIPELDVYTGVTTQGVIEKILNNKKNIDAAEGKLLSEVVVRSKKLSTIDSLNKLYATDIYQNSDQTIPMDGRNYFNIWQFLQRNIAGISVDKNQFGQVTVFFNRFMNLEAFNSEETNGDITTNIKFFLNEVPVSKDVIETIDPGDVGIVKVWKGPSASILGASRGAIAVYTQKGKSVGDWRKRGFSFFQKDGYSVSRDFFNMDYATANETASATDIRPTLYWNPQLKVNHEGKVIVNFYNDDITKAFKIVVNGIDKDGKFFNLEKIIR